MCSSDLNYCFYANCCGAFSWIKQIKLCSIKTIVDFFIQRLLTLNLVLFSLKETFLENVSLQTYLEKNHSNSSYIFLLVVIFENLTVELYVLIISFMLVKFQKDQKSIVMSSIKFFKFQVFVI